MSTYSQGNNEESLIHVIAVKHLLEQKRTDQDVKKAFHIVAEVRKELELLLKAPDDKTESKKEECKKKLLDFKKTLKTKHDLAVVEALKAYKLFSCFVIGKAQTQWDKIMHKMHSKDPWVGVNGKSHKGPRLCIPAGFRRNPGTELGFRHFEKPERIPSLTGTSTYLCTK
jgi:hypothetical protein